MPGVRCWGASIQATLGPLGEINSEEIARQDRTGTSHLEVRLLLGNHYQHLNEPKREEFI